jgi:hypothetical protein
MKKNTKTRSRPSKRPVLSSVGIAVLATFMASGSYADDSGLPAQTHATIDANGGVTNATVTGHATIGTPQIQTGDVTGDASAHNPHITVDGPQSGTSNVLTQNQLNASATGNNTNYSIDLQAIDSPTADGAATFGVGVNTGTASSTANGNLVNVDLNGFTDGSVANTQNTIGATTTLNKGTSSIAGSVPGSYVSTAPGQASVTFNSPDSAVLPGAGTAIAQGTVVVTSMQQGSGGPSSASAGGNTVRLDLSSDANNAVSASPVLDDNTISATLKGNSANSTADIQAGDSPSFSGSAVVSNLQLNSGAGVTHSASTGGSTITANVAGNEAAVNTLNGALSVQGNSITSAATGNEALGAQGVAGNRILLGDGLAVTGTGAPTQNSSAYNDGALSAGVNADLGILNSQGNVGVSLSSATAGGQVGATVQSLDGGAIDVSGNGVNSAATGNSASSAIASGKDAASFTATAAINNQQSNFQGGVTATTISTSVGATVAPDNGTTHESTVAVDNNSTAATGFGNSASQSLALDATALPLGGAVALHGGNAPDGNASAAGAATITNLQGNYSSAVTATNGAAVVGLSADSGGASPNIMTGNTLTVDTNTQEAVALSNSAGNQLTLNGGAVGAGAGISSAQIVGGGSAVESNLSGDTASLYAGTHVEDSSLALTNTLQRAIGYGNSVSNNLGVAANSVTAASTLGTKASSVTPGSQDLNAVNANYGILNTQSVQADVSSTASGPVSDPDITAVNMLVEGHVTGSSVTNEKNNFVAAAYGNDAASTATLGLGTGVAVVGGASIGNVTNVQDVTGADTAVTATATGGNVVRTSIEDAVTGSTVSTSSNQIQALAFGSRASNGLSVTGNGIDTAGTPIALGGASFDGTGATTDAAFSVQNVQSGAGSVTATQRTGTTSAAQIRSQIGGDVSNSTITADNNGSSAAATSNSAVNTLGLSGNSLATSSALQNLQMTGASVNALVGSAGTLGSSGTPDVPFAFEVQVLADSGFGGITVGAGTTITSGSVYVDASTLNSDQRAALIAGGWVAGTGADSGKLIRDASSVFPTSVDTSSVYLPLNAGLQTPFSSIVPGIPATPAVAGQGGVTLAVAGNTTGSRLSVNGNSNTAAATGNNATNTSTVSGNGIAQGSGQTVALAGLLDDDILTVNGARADHALSNDQAVTGVGTTLATSIFGTFAIDATAPATSITGSTLSVSNNTQQGTAVANTAVNTLGVSGTNLASTSALASSQVSEAGVSAASTMGVFAPGAVSNSSVDLSGNSNTSLGVINDVANTLTVAATNVSPVGPVANAQLTLTGATGDHVLSNSQFATTTVDSNAMTQLYNGDQAATATSGLANSAVTITGNSTMAEASANRADNAVALNGASLQSANAGISNVQESSAAATATATTATTFALNSILGTPALNQSSATISGNSTTALARGNTATNTLDVTAGSGYGVSAAITAGSSLDGVDGTTQATAGILNAQTNSGNVGATSTQATYQVALNATGNPTGGVSNGTVGVNTNQVVAQAFGNNATNAVTVAGLNTGRPTTAIGNYQVNSGNIIATATSVNYGIGITGGANNSTLRVAGNQVNAMAVGNSAVSSIAVAR